MSSTAPKWPLKITANAYGITLGYADFKTHNIDDLAQLAQFHIKNILLSCPGERITNTAFGVCLGQYLFDTVQGEVLVRGSKSPKAAANYIHFDEIASEIVDQIERYAGYIKIEDIKIEANDLSLFIKIKYTVALSNGVNSLTTTYNFAVDEYVVQDMGESGDRNNPARDFQDNPFA